MVRILVIDDDEQMLLMLRTMLERAGYEVLVALDGIRGMKACRSTPVDLVITDIVMPEMEGLEIIMALKREFPSMKIIAVSGGARNKPGDYLRMAAGLGANRTFTKPFDRREMLTAIKELVG
jgi:CheY-like chemotaxis protein